MANLLLTYCRYYKGEDTPPESFTKQEKSVWAIEGNWIDMQNRKAPILEDAITDYIGYGLVDFHSEDETPISLKAFLLNRYLQYEERVDIEGFKEYYEKFYKKEEEQ